MVKAKRVYDRSTGRESWVVLDGDRFLMALPNQKEAEKYIKLYMIGRNKAIGGKKS
jgi:hypothetical protein